MVGRTLGHYRVVEKLGEGGMGEVYLAEDTTLKRRVALKVLPTDVTSSRERLERFQREAESLAALNHPNIVTVFTVEEEQGSHFLTMELVEGKSLDQVIPSQGLPLEQFFSLSIPLADALSEAHEQGIVHRDLKPANIMVDRKGRPKILDFGLAKLRLPESSEDLSQLPTEVMTQEGRVLGTYPYMSPEQVAGKMVDHRSDLFSFGTVLYEMAIGERPFTGDSPASLMSSILRDSPPEVDLQREDLPHHLSRILGRCLAKDPEDRYQRAKDLREDLEELRQDMQTGVRTAARPVGVRPTGRRWGLVAALGVLLLLLAAVVLYVTKPWEETVPSAPEPQITSLAVLPLENLSGDPEQDYYAAGITDGLIADLGRIAALRVISRRSVIRYQDSDLPLPEIAEELGVQALIEGSVLPVGDRVRITAQLVQADPEQQLWAETYERDAKDILSLLSEVTRAITNEVRVAVSPGEEALLAGAQQVDPEAHRAYLRGQHAFRRGTPADVAKAAEYFREALEIDPDYALAWTGLAAYHLSLEIWALPWGAEDLRRMSSHEADAALDRSLELDDSSSQAHMLRGWVEWFRNWNWEEAEIAFLRAIELNPNDPDSRTWYARFLSAMGRYKEAIGQNEIAEQLEPLSALVHRVWGDIYYFGHDFEASVRSYRRALELDPEDFYALAMMGFPLAAMGEAEEAWNAWMTYRRAMGQEALANSMEGKSWEEATRLVLEAIIEPDSVNSGPAWFAWAHSELGEYQQALDWLEQGYATKKDRGKTAGSVFLYLKVAPFFDPLHSDPRFQDLLRRMNLAD